ncbi:MAG TPA: LuxR C-terminal-related transcriptional regulator [Anaerolineales bacterium]|nr:LuxR C-terminal-related transcriptional regulator [Anaerolineales bacterium]
MAVPVLATKLYIPPSRPKVVTRSHLIERLNEGLRHMPGVTLISAPAGFGKTTLVSEWVTDCQRPAAWLSLDEGDNDAARFLTYLIAALQTISPNLGGQILGLLQTPQPPPPEAIWTDLLNEISTIPESFLLVLDDYHMIDAKAVDRVLNFLLEHQPPQMHIVIATREDPDLPLARLRARGQLTELRAADLRFTLPEAAEFLNRVMGLKLSAEMIAALETRTEGWIAGLQLAALSMQGQQDITSFIQSFTGSHHFVMDYLMEEVLQQQSESVQMFLLYTSILERLCSPLCDAVLGSSSGFGQETLQYLEHTNLFIVPLDHERRWYRYHHLFADLLRQRLPQSIAATTVEAEQRVCELHVRASQWYEDNGLQLEAFQHAAAAKDIERAERLAQGKGIPLHFSGGVTPILNWLESLPKEVLDARPSLWWRHASLLLINGQTAGVAEKLQAAEVALAAKLQGASPDAETRNLIGQIAAAKATLALTRYDIETMLVQSRRALEYLDPNNLSTRASANWTMGFAYALQGDRTAARRTFMEAISISQSSGAMFTLILATIGLANIQELDNELYQAAETCQRILEWVGDKPQQIIGEVHLCLARIFYEWNDLDAAEQYARQSLILTRQYENVIDRYIFGEIFLARLELARGDVNAASAQLAKVDQSVRQRNFMHRLPDVAAAQVLTLLRQDNPTVAAQVAQAHNLPISQARVYLAQGDTSAALNILNAYQQQVQAKGWQDEQLKVRVLQAVAHHMGGERDQALQRLGEALMQAERGGFIRLFLDEGLPMAQLLSEAAAQGIMPDYIAKLLAAFEAEPGKDTDRAAPAAQSLVEPLSQRELEVLQLIAQGLSNREISARLFLALDTVKGHNRRIYDKLQVQRRTEAVARARGLGLL